MSERAITAETDKVGTARCAVRTPQRGVPTMQLETERLVLRSFREEDVDAMAQLFANPDFMRFSLGAFTERKKTVDFIEKVMGWDRASMPLQFAVLITAVFTIILKYREKSRSGTDCIPITGIAASSQRLPALCAITPLPI